MMNPNEGKDYGKMSKFDNKEEHKKLCTELNKVAGQAPPQQWPVFQYGETLKWKGHVWKVIEIGATGKISIVPVMPISRNPAVLKK